MRRVLSIAGVFGLLAAGCGGGSAPLSKSAYQNALDATLTRVENATIGAYAPTIQSASSSPSSCEMQAGNSIRCEGGAGVKVPTRAELARSGARIRAAFDRAASSLAALEPPADVVGDNRALAAGLRGAGALYDDVLRANPRSRSIGELEAKLRAAQNSVTAGIERAASDLERKGYSVGFLSAKRPRLERPAHACPGCTAPGGVPHPKRIKSLPFSLVSRAGTQPASDLQACGDCSGVGLLVGKSALIPAHLSVVRPGERVRIAGPAARGFVALTVTKLCRRLGRPVLDMLVRSFAWTPRLSPGRYVVAVDLFRPAAAGRQETGIVGLLVSRTLALRVLPRPSCS